MAASWLCGREPKRTIWNHEPRLQHTLNTILATRRFDLIQVEDGGSMLMVSASGTAVVIE